ncbi:hypothetical protein MTR67_023482 [Solanum verrucosum]|uniref:Reverse transcriptase domain-containing protein n=1 Tax=Solanum verrucosum TaxID=315347 RepID=A0AAF0TRF2_SOLVR|nr:hypothetical protein MTR67_023482 [Solanum verrucosum]
MGFSNQFIDMVWRLIANNWYSILFNGQPKGSFHSTRGVKQGDPLSPALFILSAEILSRALNSLFENHNFVGYGMPNWSRNINHIAYVDDTIIFSSAEEGSLKQIMRVIKDYETISGQLVNKEKRFFYMFHKVEARLVEKVEQITGFSKGNFPFKYLGCPVFHNRKRKEYYNDMIKKVKEKLQNWRGKLLSFVGVVLIESVLQSTPIYLLSVVVLTKYTINEIDKIFARFFWRKKVEVSIRYLGQSCAYQKKRANQALDFFMIFLKHHLLNSGGGSSSNKEVVGHKALCKTYPYSSSCPCFYLLAIVEKKEYYRAWGNMTKWKVIQEINSNLVKLVKLKYPWIKVIPNQWPQLVQHFEQYRPLIKSQVVIWRKPEIGWLKCNTDGACRGNLGERSAAFCIRDADGNLVYAEAKRLWITNSIQAEARAIQGGIQHCIE